MIHASRRSLILLTALLPSLVVTIAWFVHRWVKLDSSAAYFSGAVGNLCALIGISIFIIMVLTGMRFPVIEKTFGLDRLMRFHIMAGPIVIILFISHAVLRFTKVSLLSPDGWQWPFLLHINADDIGLSLGKIALAGAILAAGLAKLGRYFVPYNFWKPFHFLLYAAIPIGFAHARIKGDDIIEFPYNIIFYILAGIFLISFIYRMNYLYRRNELFIWDFANASRETHDTNSFYLKREGTKHFFGRRVPGQFAVIRYLKSGTWSEPRPFTISSEPGSDRISLTIKNTGKFTSGMHSLEKGTKVMCEGPYGIFYPDFKREKKLVFIAGGVGITPFLSILRHIKKVKEDCDVTIIWSVKTHGDIIAKDELEKISGELSGRLKIIIIITRENKPEPGKESEVLQSDSLVYEYGRMNENIFKKYIKGSDSSVYLCGPQRMQAFVLTALKKYLGIKPASVKREGFFW